MAFIQSSSNAYEPIGRNRKSLRAAFKKVRFYLISGKLTAKFSHMRRELTYMSGSNGA